MNAKPIFTALACLSLTAVSLLVIPARTYAQDAQTPGSDTNSNSDASNQLIKLDLENADLYSALKLLFAQIKANYTLDPSLRQVPVTAHLTNIPFRTALDVLLRSANSPVPLTYKVESGVYSIMEKMTYQGFPIDPVPVDNSQPVSNRSQYKKFYGTTGEIKYNSAYLAKLLGAKLIPSIVQEPQGQGGFGSGGFGGGMGGFGSGGSLGGFGGGFGNGGSLGGIGGVGFGSNSGSGNMGNNGNNGSLPGSNNGGNRGGF